MLSNNRSANYMTTSTKESDDEIKNETHTNAGTVTGTTAMTLSALATKNSKRSINSIAEPTASSAISKDSTSHHTPILNNKCEKVAELKEEMIDGQKTTICRLLAYDMNMRLLCKIPYVVWIENFISNEEADQIVAMAKQRMIRSSIGTNSTIHSKNEIKIFSQHRTSSSAGFVRKENTLIAEIETRLMYLASTTIDHIEPLQVTAYAPEQHYLNHYDTKAGDALLTDDGGLRIHTFLIYLQDVPSGAKGATFFPKLNLRVQPKKGCVLWWRNVRVSSTALDGTQTLKVDDYTLHTGEKLAYGEKHLINGWIRHLPYVMGTKTETTMPSSKVIVGKSLIEQIASELSYHQRLLTQQSTTETASHSLSKRPK